MTEEISLRYPIGIQEDQDYFHAEFAESIKTSLVLDIRMLPSSLELSIENLDAEHLETPYRPGGWTINQLVHHVADSHINAYTRFKLALTEENPTIKPYEQDAWASLADSKIVPLNISLTLLHALHSRWSVLMESLSATQWQRTCFHPETKTTINLWDLLKTYSWHGRHHTAHILEFRKRNLLT